MYFRDYLETIMFVSGQNSSIQHPLLYRHPMRHDDTIMLALGSLSGLYLRINKDGTRTELSKEETQYIQDILETKILSSNLIHTHHWTSGELLLLNNPSLAHFAGPGSQGSFEVTGLRLMHRSTVGGKVRPTKRSTENVAPLQYNCFDHPPFQHQEYCLFSLKVWELYISISIFVGFVYFYRMQCFIHIMENLRQLLNKDKDARMFTKVRIWQLYQTKLGTKYFFYPLKQF